LPSSSQTALDAYGRGDDDALDSWLDTTAASKFEMKSLALVSRPCSEGPQECPLWVRSGHWLTQIGRRPRTWAPCPIFLSSGFIVCCSVSKRKEPEVFTPPGSLVQPTYNRSPIIALRRGSCRWSAPLRNVNKGNAGCTSRAIESLGHNMPSGLEALGTQHEIQTVDNNKPLFEPTIYRIHHRIERRNALI
jgi:hypothetical protein